MPLALNDYRLKGALDRYAEDIFPHGEGREGLLLWRRACGGSH
jgi:hypothetical protein